MKWPGNHDGGLPGRGAIALGYLARRADGIEPVRRFLGSYRAHEPGVDHDLFVLWKGFPDADSKADWRREFAGLAHRDLEFEDVGYDVTTYVKASAIIDREYLCFLNTWSAILAPGWLAILARHASRPGVGVVGATGSYESHYSEVERAAPPPPELQIGRNPFKWSLMTRIWVEQTRERERHLRHYSDRFAPFPNPHLRTNAFMIRRDLMTRIALGEISSKEDAWQFESGRRGLTRQVLGLGLEVLVVGRDGEAYRAEDWPASRTFRIHDQENLLISDNQTRAYDRASPESRRRMESRTWGSPAPGPSEAEGVRGPSGPAGPGRPPRPSP